MSDEQSKPGQIVVGITVDADGQALVDASVKEALFDLAEFLETPTGLPVDVEHVVGALVMARRKEEISSVQSIDATDEHLTTTLVPHVKQIFRVFGGRLDRES